MPQDTGAPGLYLVRLSWDETYYIAAFTTIEAGQRAVLDWLKETPIEGLEHFTDGHEQWDRIAELMDEVGVTRLFSSLAPVDSGDFMDEEQDT